MKPKYIFTAVFAICLIMGSLLPRMGSPTRAAAAAAPGHTQAAPVGTQATPAYTGSATALAAPTTAALASVYSPLANLPPATVPPATLPPATLPPLPIAPTRPVPVRPGSVRPTAVPPQQAAVQASAGAIPPALAATADAPTPAGAPVTASLPELSSFAASLANGQASQLVGVYAPGLFALPVVQQPAGDEEFVSSADQTVTQYSLPASFGVVGLLAHNTLSGYNFFKLKAGQEVVLIYGSGRQAHYKITASQRYQALSPYDAHSNFVDLNGPGGQILNYQQVFDRVYTQSSQLVFQTCFEANGDPSWGRVFYMAQPV